MTTKKILALVALVTACSDEASTIDAPEDTIDAPPTGDPDARVDAAPAACTPVNGTNVVVRRLPFDITTARPLLVTSPLNGDPRLFIVEQSGRIYIAEDEVLRPQAFLDISDNAGGSVSDAGNEAGLLGLAFHPLYATNRKFYVFYTTNRGSPDPQHPITHDVVSEYTAMAGDPYAGDPSSERILLEVLDDRTNHNGGMIEFGNDGFLYISIGDGGRQGDPLCVAQDPNSLLGKILRIDVDNPSGGNNYGIPPGNPFAGGGGAPEVWMLGFRNPWRWSFDRETGDIYIGDVGQDSWEEVSVVPAAMQAGANLGWNRREGGNPYSTSCTPGPGSPIDPVYDSNQGNGFCSVIGGQVYRGSCFPDLNGVYFYTDYCAAPIYGLQKFVYSGGMATAQEDDITPTFLPSPTSIHADTFGELYVTSGDGGIYRIEASP